MGLDEELRVMRLIQMFVACLSLVGEVFVVLCYLVFIERKTFRVKLIVGLMIANFVATIADLMVYANKYKVLCILEGFLRNYGEVSALMWTVTISQISYKEILEPKYIRKGRLRKAVYLSCLFPFVYSLM